MIVHIIILKIFYNINFVPKKEVANLEIVNEWNRGLKFISMLAIFKFCSTQFLLNTGRTHLTNLRLLLVVPYISGQLLQIWDQKMICFQVVDTLDNHELVLEAERKNEEFTMVITVAYQSNLNLSRMMQNMKLSYKLSFLPF